MPDSPWIRFFGLAFILLVVQLLYLSIVNQDLLVRRLSVKRGTEPWDWLWGGLYKLVFVAVGAVAALDARSGAALLPSWAERSGFALFFLGFALFLWAMGANPFFEGTARIQSERGHHVIDKGPYRFVRHPGYVGMVLVVLSFPPILGSARAFFPAGVVVALIVVRAAFEDRTLRAKLAGYADYTTRVRSRLIPGVW